MLDTLKIIRDEIDNILTQIDDMYSFSMADHFAKEFIKCNIVNLKAFVNTKIEKYEN